MKPGLIDRSIVMVPTMAITSAGMAAAIEKARTMRKCRREAAAPARQDAIRLQPSATTIITSSSSEKTSAANRMSASVSLGAIGESPDRMKKLDIALTSARTTASGPRRFSNPRPAGRSSGSSLVLASVIHPCGQAAFSPPSALPDERMSCNRATVLRD